MLQNKASRKKKNNNHQTTTRINKHHENIKSKNGAYIEIRILLQNGFWPSNLMSSLKTRQVTFSRLVAKKSRLGIAQIALSLCT